MKFYPVLAGLVLLAHPALADGGIGLSWSSMVAPDTRFMVTPMNSDKRALGNYSFIAGKDAGKEIPRVDGAAMICMFSYDLDHKITRLYPSYSAQTEDDPEYFEWDPAFTEICTTGDLDRLMDLRIEVEGMQGG